MPRHRKERNPKHRTQPPKDKSGRRVSFDAAIDAARAALESAHQNGPGTEGLGTEGLGAEGPDTEELGIAGPGIAGPGIAGHGTEGHGTAPLPSLRYRGRRSGPPDSRPPGSSPRGPRRPSAGAPRSQQHRMRGLLVTPWFAAGAGFVIAAALALNSPHAVLTYRPNTVPCRLCTEPTPQKGSEASATPGVQIRPVRPAKSAHARRGTGKPDSGPVAGLEVSFRVVWHKYGEFGAIITVPASRARHGWSLRFDMPGVRITQVWGAQWQSAPGGHGGLARMLTRQPGQQPGSPRHSGRPGDSGPGRGHGQSGAQGQAGSQELLGSQGSPWDWTQPDVRFLVVARGSPVTPVGCVLNGAGCHFG